MRGLLISVRYLHFYQKLLITSGILLILFIFLRKKITMSKAVTVESLLLKNGLRPDIASYATAQAAHETGNFTSYIFLMNNNCYGMKYAGQLTAQGEKNGYAYYDTLENCIVDYVAWFNLHRSVTFPVPYYITSLSDFVSFLKGQSYFEDTTENYLKGCSWFLKMYFPDAK